MHSVREDRGPVERPRGPLATLVRRVVLDDTPPRGTLALRMLLRAGSWLFSAGWLLRRGLYAARLLPRHRVPAPVVSVGNLTLGGTGKTPLVEWIARWCTRRRIPCAILSRGYGPVSGGPGALDDESAPPEDIGEALRLVHPDRTRMAREAVRRHGARLLILDDGCQHWRLHRELEIVLVDALRPFANGSLLPRGALREPPQALRRAHLLGLTRCNQVSESDLELLRRRLRALAPAAALFHAVHRPVAWRRLGAEAPSSPPPRGPVLGFCGLGNPEGFLRTLDSSGLEVRDFVPFADHHRYREADVAALLQQARRVGANALVTTTKDARRFPVPLSGALPVLALKVRLEIVDGAECLESALERLLS